MSNHFIQTLDITIFWSLRGAPPYSWRLPGSTWTLKYPSYRPIDSFFEVKGHSFEHLRIEFANVAECPSTQINGLRPQILLSQWFLYLQPSNLCTWTFGEYKRKSSQTIGVHEGVFVNWSALGASRHYWFHCCLSSIQTCPTP